MRIVPELMRATFFGLVCHNTPFCKLNTRFFAHKHKMANTKHQSKNLPWSADHLTYDMIAMYFEFPMHEASVFLKTDETSLKKRCRSLGISR